MDDGRVRMWRPAGQEGVLLLAGRTEHYAVDPRGEYVFGVVLEAPMRSQRGHERRLVAPGQLVAWDPSHAHSGASVDRRPWAARLMVVEAAELSALTSDSESVVPAGSAFPEPVCADPTLAADFVRLHAALEAPATRLERDVRLASWLNAVSTRHSARSRRQASARGQQDDPALRRAHDYLAEHAAQNVSLDDLAAAAGIGKFRLIRLFRARTGLAPHSLQLAHRVRTARRLLESGCSIADAATGSGFADQSHLHRHFQRTLGMTPGEYRTRAAPRPEVRSGSWLHAPRGPA